MFRSTMIALCLLVSIAAAKAQSIPTIPASEASKHLGEQVTVCGQVVSKHTADNANGEPTFVDLDHAFPNQTFTVLIWDRDRSKVGDLPSSGNVCVTGTITQYKGVSEIVLHDAKGWRVPAKPAMQ